MAADRSKLINQDLINQGLAEAKNLTECLKVDFNILFKIVFPKASKAVLAQVKEATQLGILKRMDAVASVLLESQSLESLNFLREHPSDTVRGWGAFTVGKRTDLKLPEKLKLILPYADDSHFGVREWAWLAVRGPLAQDIPTSVKLLTPLTAHRSFRVRRFASEALRPRGVWAEHIQLLKEKPELGLPLLSPLHSDPERYVQDSVANWLNDAAKTQGPWVKKLCSTWTKQSKTKETAYIVKRALRSL